MSSLQSVIRHAIGWYYSLGHKFFHVTPAAMIMGQTASLLSQTLLVSALILPIKILVLIGTENIPNYYPDYLQSLEKTHLVFALSLLALVCYCLYAVSEIVVHTCSISGAKKLIEKSSKLKLFENQQQFSVKVYSRFVRSLAAGLFFIMINVALVFIYPLLFIATVFYVSIVLWSVVLLHNKKEKIRRIFISHKSTAINFLSSAGFLVLFFIMIADYIYLSVPQLFTAVISLLLVRQGFSRLAVMTQDILELRNQYRKINALFFHDQQWVVESATDTQLPTNLFSDSRRHQWMLEALSSIGLTPGGILSSQWHQLGRADIYGYEAMLACAETGQPTNVLFKVFGANSSSMAQQERVLLENVPDIPAPGFLGAANVEHLICHIFELGDHRKLKPGEVGPGAADINRQLLSIEPTDNLIEQFRRSHLFLEQRLSSDILDRLTLVVSGTECLLLERFGQAYEGIKRILAQLPRQIIALDASSDTLLLRDTDGICVSHWANWRMEPVGASWAVTERVKLEEAVTCAQETRPSLLNVAATSIVLCAVVYAFERLCQRTHYRNALALVPQILDLYESIGPLPSSPQEDTSCHA